MKFQITSPEAAGMSSARLARIDDFMQHQVQHSEFAGINTLIARRGKIVHFGQYGYRDREAKLPMQADTIFRLYSMTKPIVCTAFMTLYEQGKFDLKDPVSKFIPAFAHLKVLEKAENSKEKLVDLKQPVTIWHLLTHTSGLVYDFYEEYSVCELYRENRLMADTPKVSLKEFIDKICQLPLAFQPGEKWFYSTSIDVIARLIEIIAGKPLDKFLYDTIFAPLGMADMAFCLPEEKHHRVAAMYGGLDIAAPHVTVTKLMDAWQHKAHQRLDVSHTHPLADPHFQRGGFGLMGRAEDYLRFAQMLLNKGEFNGVRILSPKTVNFMHMNHLNAEQLPIGFGEWKLLGYGFGLGSSVTLNVAESQMPGSEGEFGWSGAAKTLYWVDPKEELVLIFLTQSMCNFSLIDRVFHTLAYQALLA